MKIRLGLLVSSKLAPSPTPLQGSVTQGEERLKEGKGRWLLWLYWLLSRVNASQCERLEKSDVFFNYSFSIPKQGFANRHLSDCNFQFRKPLQIGSQVPKKL
jgi:hypothetical protein